MGTNIAIGNLVGKQKGSGGASNSYKLIAEYVFNKNNMDTDRNKVFNKLNSDQFIELYNFSWSLMSGYGGYNENYLKYKKAANVFITDDHSITIMNFIPANTFAAYLYDIDSIKATKVRVTGLTATNQLTYEYSPSDGGSRAVFPIPEDGEYDLPESIPSSSENAGYNVGFVVRSALTKNVIIEQVPAYPDCLVFDGVDDYTSIMPALNKEVGTIMLQYNSPALDTKGCVLQAWQEGEVGYYANCFLINNSSIQARAEGNVVKGSIQTSTGNKISAFAWDSEGIDLFNNGQYIETDAINKHTKYNIGKDNNGNLFAHFALKKILIFDKKLNEKQILEEYNKLLSNGIRNYNSRLV